VLNLVSFLGVCLESYGVCTLTGLPYIVFKHCPFLVRDSVARDLDTLQSQWKSLKYRTPTRGAIILNQDLTKCLLVQGYPASTSWGFPKGKLERGESDQDCAIREIYEETGFDIRALIRSEHYLECESRDGERASRMYIIPGVPEETEFKPRVRKEIRDIQWFRVEDLPRFKKDLATRQNLGKNPSSFFMIIPFISQLKKWISNYQRARGGAGGGRKATRTVSAAFPRPSAPLQPTRRSSNSPSPSSSSHLPRRTASSRTINSGQQKASAQLQTQPHSIRQSTPSMRAVSGPSAISNTTGNTHSGQQKGSAQLQTQPRVVGQSLLIRAVSGPPGGRLRPLNPVFGQLASDGPINDRSDQGSGVIRSHTVPHPAHVLFQGHHRPHVTPHPAPQPHRSLPPPPHPLAALWQAPAHKHHPSHPHYTHSSPLAQQQHYVPHPTSAFNPVATTSANQRSNSYSKGAPASNFNPFAALGVSTATTPPGSSKDETRTVCSPYQWNGNVAVFRPVQVKLKPAKSWTGFKFDKPRILSAMWSDIGCF
jgi:8-oxo-dGTP pyrophosphatase MutT (NUDIX family)